MNFLVWASIKYFSSKLHFPLTISRLNLAAFDINFATHDKNSHQLCLSALTRSPQCSGGADPKSRSHMTPGVALAKKT